MTRRINEKNLHNIVEKSLRKALNESNIYTDQWDAEKEMFFNGLTTGRAFFDNNIVYVEYPGDVNDNDPRYISYELGDNRLRDDHFSMQHSPTLSDKEIREIYLTLQDKYGYNGPMPENEYYESVKRNIHKIIKESLRRKLNEGTTDEEAYNKWEWLKDSVGAETIVDNLFDWLDSNTIDKIIGWFDEEGYFEGYYDDGMFESKIHRIVRKTVNKRLNENSETQFTNNQNYSHFAVNKETNKIVNGWDYHDYDSDELKTFKKDYFINDLIDYELNPRNYKILTDKTLRRMGIDPNDNNNWANS